jgi:PAS domain S-box-containing protein
MLKMFNKKEKKCFDVQSILGGLPQPLFVADKDLNIIYFNDAVAKLTGYTREEAIGKKCHDIFKANICESGCAIKYCMKESATINDAEVTITSKSGEVIPILANAAPLRNDTGEIVGGMETLQDIRHEKEVEEKMAAESARGTARIYDAIFARDIDENITYFNDAAEKLTGYKREEVLGKKCSDVFRANICQGGCLSLIHI